MGTAAHLLRRLVEVALAPLDRLPPWAALTHLALLGGVALLFIVARLTHQRRLGRARDRMIAALYELRLFWDAPAQMARAFGRVVTGAGRYLAHLLPAALVVTGPALLLGLHLEARYGLGPLALGEPAVVRVTLAPGVDPAGLSAGTDGPGLVLTAPPLPVGAEGRVYLRVEPRTSGRHRLVLLYGRTAVGKEVACGAVGGPIAATRARGAAVLTAPGVERPLGAGPVARIDVLHPARDVRVLGLPWWLYALGVATGIAFIVRRPAGVVL